MNKPMTILSFAGSLRKNSYNKALLRAAVSLAPKEARIEIFDLEGIPLFDQDFERQPSEKVKEFKAEIRAVDALLIVTPEYNFSVSGVLKNAIDWASRPPDDNAFEDKPVALMSASIGTLGGARAQYHLRQVFVALDMHVLNWPEVMVARAGEKFDKNGNLTDEKTKERIGELLESLVDWAHRLKRE